MTLASGNAGECGPVHDVYRGFLWLLGYRPKSLDRIQQPVVNRANNRVFPYKVTVDGIPLHMFHRKTDRAYCWRCHPANDQRLARMTIHWSDGPEQRSVIVGTEV